MREEKGREEKVRVDGGGKLGKEVSVIGKREGNIRVGK